MSESKRLDIQAIKDAALDRWPLILQAAGVDLAFLKNKHGPCPVCGGKDRFRYTDLQGRGGNICNQHNPNGGDGFSLLMAYRQINFIQAARFVTEVLGGAAVVAMAPDAAVMAERKALEDAEQRRAFDKAKAENFALWHSSLPILAGCPVGLYLSHRGLALADYPKALRFNPAIPYWDKNEGKLIKLGNYPAMIAAVQAPNDTAVALHKTHLQTSGHKAQVPSVKKWSAKSADAKGAAVRLFPAAERMAVAEGIETALAVYSANGLPVWAGLSAFGVAAMVLPSWVQEVFIFADHDENQTGQKAANQLAERLISQDKTVRILYPSIAGVDWLDVLTKAEK